ncbi:MAG: DnaJ C-terminal domain-containing protein [Alphaproteobacteria bacterium]
MRNPYDVIGVPRSASQEDIKKAYRKRAKELHPDTHPGDRRVEQRFKEVSAAHDILGDEKKRARFDRGEIDADGRERPEYAFHRAYGAANRGAKAPGGFSAHDIFDELFGQGGVKTKGANVSYTLTVDFLDAARGARRRVVLSGGRSLEVNIPPGTEHGQTLRLKGQGMAGMGGGAAGDALIEIHVAPHRHFTRDGRDILIEVPVTLHEAVLGASIEVPTIDGKVAVKVPRGANSGTQLRLKGKGIVDGKAERGDQYVKLKVMLPNPPDEDLTKFLDGWRPKRPYDPRKKARLV